MKTKAKLFLLGLVLGSLAAFPIGINFGRDEPLLSNPFAAQDLQKQVVQRVKSTTEAALEDARETVHEATRPLAQTN